MISGEDDRHSQYLQIVLQAIEIEIDRAARWSALRLLRPHSDDVNAMQSWLEKVVALSDKCTPMKDCQKKEGGNNEKVKTIGQETLSPQTSLLTKKHDPHLAEAVGFSERKARQKHKQCGAEE